MATELTIKYGVTPKVLLVCGLACGYGGAVVVKGELACGYGGAVVVKGELACGYENKAGIEVELDCGYGSAVVIEGELDCGYGSAVVVDGVELNCEYGNIIGITAKPQIARYENAAKLVAKYTEAYKSVALFIANMVLKHCLREGLVYSEMVAPSNIGDKDMVYSIFTATYNLKYRDVPKVYNFGFYLTLKGERI